MGKADTPPDTIFGQFQTGSGGEPHGTRSIGELIQDAKHLSPEDLEKIAEYQRAHGLRFGEAAIALGLATAEDVLQALSQQFNYAVGKPDQQSISDELVTLVQPFGHQAEAFRAMRSQFLLRARADAGAPRMPMAVVSTRPGDGKSFFCANLAVSLAQLGGRVLLIDADLRGPRLHHVFGVDNSKGLTNVLSGRGGRGVIKSVHGIDNLFLIPVGVQPPNPLELVESTAFGLLLREVTVKFDHVVVDTPAISLGVDGMVVASRCGSALVVGRKNTSRMAELRDLTARLQSAQTRLLGVVMNEF
ncbi:polysaccharide biosynthesis tyrosine autokinase [Ideonella livida]|uniref:Polysaccharide biosynthesis tyrosine autokinase n=1 Tax=Ideonella livida TaxID=2707176 RepID=A0A7C9PH52_9BURK|nr:polysaccharide biosynthesis tyrosine autokinase [Ideonella livida]NDY90914.1 polysaccharide biosynthesis tyrosine autokinase [Ideonella livida]